MFKSSQDIQLALQFFFSTNFPMKKFSSADIITYSARKCVLLLPSGKEALHSCLLLLEDGVSIYMFNYLSIWLFSRSDLPSRTHTCFWILQLPLGLCMINVIGNKMHACPGKRLHQSEQCLGLFVEHYMWDFGTSGTCAWSRITSLSNVCSFMWAMRI